MSADHLVQAYVSSMARVSAIFVAHGCDVSDAHDPDADMIVRFEWCEWWLRLSVAEEYASAIAGGADVFETLSDSIFTELQP